MDAQIGRILDHLEETGQADNTYIFFAADHGLSVGQHGLMGKQNMYDHSMRPPMIVVGPDVPKGKRKDMAVYLQDIMATSFEYAGGEVPEWVEFNSLKAFIDEEKTSSDYPEVYGAYMDLQRMIRADDYKLIVYPKAGIVKLFDLKNDPDEIKDLSAISRHEDRIRTMFNKLEIIQHEMGDTLQLGSFAYRLEFL
jgi:arylsulfatase A-like enzyme